MSIKLEVKGMTCGHCEGAVEKALAGVPGVTKVIEVSKDREQVVVDGTPNPEDLVAAIVAEGYEARVAG